MRHLHPHTGDTPESFRPHTNFGMAVGSMQTWNLSWLFTDIEYFFTHYYPWSVRDHPNTILPRGLQRPRGSLTLRHWRCCGGSPRPLLQSRDNSCIIAKKKAHYEHLSSNQSCVFVSCCLRAAAAAAAAATVIVQMIPERKRRLEQTPCYAVAKLPATAADRMAVKQMVGSRTK